MVQENLDSYLLFSAKKGTVFNQEQKDALKIKASKEFAEQILKMVTIDSQAIVPKAKL
jgi:hypothetical protein